MQHFPATCVFLPQWRSCFAGVISKYHGITNRVLRLRRVDGNALYISAVNLSHSHGGTPLPSCSGYDVVLFMNPIFARLNGIKENDDVGVEMTDFPCVPQCSSLTVEALSIEDWKLTDQIRVVHVGERFPVQIGSSACVLLKVTATTPIAEFVQLTRGTEVIVQPPDSNTIHMPDTTLHELPALQHLPAIDYSNNWLSSLMPWLDSVPGNDVCATASARSVSASGNSTSLSESGVAGNIIQEEAGFATVAANDVENSVTLHEKAAADCSSLFSLFSNSSGVATSLFLLVCGDKMSGKSCFTMHLRYLLQAESLKFHVQRICCKELSGRKLQFITTSIETAFEMACKHERSAIVLDDLDYLCSAPTTSQTSHNNEDVDAFSTKLPNYHDNQDDRSHTDIYFDRVAHVLVELQRTIRQYCVQNNAVIYLIATARAENAVHTMIQCTLSSRHYFDHIVTLNVPDAETRADFCMQQFRARFKSKNCDTDSALLTLRREHRFDERTSRFSVGDLKQLTALVCHQLVLQQALDKFDISTFIFAVNKCVNEIEHEKQPHLTCTRAEPTLTWSDAGTNTEFIERLRDIFELPALYPKLVALCPVQLPRGVLLYGIPGSGKTFLCRVVADAAHFRRVFFVKGPELLTKYIGASEARVRQLFAEARQCAPSLVIFDEFDALAPRRGHDSTGVTDRVVNQLLAELDGMHDSRGISVIATSSRPDLIDEALLRPGRIDVSLKCELPSADERQAILAKLCATTVFSVLVANRENQPGFWHQVAAQCADFTAADLRALVYDAQLSVVRTGSKLLGEKQSDLLLKFYLESATKAGKPALSQADRARFDGYFIRFTKRRSVFMASDTVDEAGHQNIMALQKTSLA